jgi:hypothetical protein
MLGYVAPLTRWDAAAAAFPAPDHAQILAMLNEGAAIDRINRRCGDRTAGQSG